MKRENELLERFDHLNSIEPSAEWNRKLMIRIDKAGERSAGKNDSKMLFFAIILLIAINLFSYSKSWLDTRSGQNNDKMKLIASEYLISTNSSKY